ncbi:4-(cytidine 5'-diphospho)-2-C-methyl-D-erythritol kinase [Alteromonas sp. ASW11-130]|uniref:4-(cytidine 5'-diphospho)-2-C-methyl-D-erythritol kinase n=1 Tax=Alteromonas sp. ASW11-130 TaxID=3015775 RepID=UPI0022424873|nr:4-(cytidine 5'-diphospho)-2-C-methyl-D-erythritol kinase [Alteromonas sp. ASW11-130]MCW8090674.1 4-(cytidine 5'-diphospho)-2-C-methyl-D-erythritol kinase [Alteromonas sp. ASW11-130]
MDDQLIDWWPSPAKLNLFLHILGRNQKGYHLLQTLFQMLDVGDQIAFTLTDDGKIAMSQSLEGVPDDQNLIVRAARLLQSTCETSKGAIITLDKQLPMGGGIGGGSSNAATTLVALNELWNCKLNTTELAELGLLLGADVPIFIHGLTAFAGGVGENIYPVKIPCQWYLVANPGIHISTAEVFAAPELPRNSAAMNWQHYKFEETRNDCQTLVTNRHPEVANLLQWLVHYAPSRMTGTGACVFATFASEAQAKEVQAKLPDKWSSFVAKGVDQSPLKIKQQQVRAASDM